MKKMTKIHSLTLKPKSPWITPLQADTIFGHLCWKIVQNESKEKLEGFLKDMKSEPFFLISNGFPCGYISRPRLEFEFRKEEKSGKGEMRAEFERAKKYAKNINFIKIGDLKEYFFRFSEIEDMKIEEGEKEKEAKKQIDKIMEEMAKRSEKKECQPQSFEKDREIKTTINRFTSTTLEDQGPYPLPYFSSKGELWILIKVIDEEKFKEYNIKENLKKVFSEGYGKRKSIGRGVFEIVRYCEEEKIFQNPIGKRYLLLSNFIPNKKDPSNGLYEIFVKYGKLGEEKSIAGAGNFYKKPLIMIKEGATFKVNNQNNQEYFGRMLREKEILLHYDPKKFGDEGEILHYAYGFSLKF